MPARLVVLKNGLRVVLVPCEAESVAFGLFIESGSRHEAPEFAGISHFIEHMLFKGTPTRRTVDITRAIEGRGGNFNAMTGEETTGYFAHMPDDYLDEAVDILSDMYLRATIPEDEFEREKQVIVEEIKMYADEPDSVAIENLQRSLFPGDPLGRPVAGTPESLAPLRPDDLRRYIRSHYVPGDTVVVVAGSFDSGAALRAVEKSFVFPKRSASAKQAFASRRQRPSPRHVCVEKDVQQTQLALGYRTFGLADRRIYAASVMDAMLGRGMSSRLFQEVREKRGLSYDIASRMQFFTDAGMFTVTAGVDPSKAERALATTDRELRRICEKRVSAAELKRTKDFLVGNFRLSLENVTAKMFFYGKSMLAFGRAMSPQEQVEGIGAVTSDDIMAVARAILKPGLRVVSSVVPRHAADAASAKACRPQRFS